MLYFLLIFYSVIFAVGAWAYSCIEKCYRQQLKLIDQIAAAGKASGYTKSYFHVIDAVPFEMHLWRLLTFRDPWAIYPPALDEVRKAGA